MHFLPSSQPDRDPRPSVSNVAMMVTRRCNMTCAHCSVESSPGVKGNPDEADLLRRVQQSAAAGVRSILFTGGEPMIREAVVLRLMREAKSLGLSSGMTSNGFWGKTPEGAKRRLLALRKAGLKRLSISFDRYHAEFQGSEPALNIAHAAEELNFVISIGITRVADDADLETLIAPFRSLRSVRLRFYDVQPVGSARHLDPDSLRGETEGFCSACSSPAITDDGRMTACNGPSYFLKSPSPLVIGSLDESSAEELLKRHRQDPVLDTIRTFGPGRLRDELKSIPGFEEFPFRDQYHGMCELCHHVTGNPEAVMVLRERLSEPQHVAGRLAMQQVMDDSKRSGSLNRDHVNGIGAARLFFHAADGGVNPWSPETSKVLGRADIDWNELAHYLSICGLARPLLSSLDNPELRRWAPTFFIDAIRQRAIVDGVRELLQREILRRLSNVLSDIGTSGILLKGGAMLALHNPNASGSGTIERSCGDIDVYVPQELAIKVRERLLQTGFQGSTDHGANRHHHLNAVSFQGVPVEIHTRITHPWWSLPQREMIERAVPLPTDPFANLSTLDAEGMLLHTVVHVSQHLFSFGLKTAWDVRWLVRHFGEMDWDRLSQWADSSGMRRAFWVPIRVLCRELDIPVPLDFLDRAPCDACQRKLELIARSRLFSSREKSYEWGRAVIVLMQDSWIDKLNHVARGVSRFAIRALRNPRSSTHHFGHYIRHSFSYWRQCR